jgi:hypothetical protein
MVVSEPNPLPSKLLVVVPFEKLLEVVVEVLYSTLIQICLTTIAVVFGSVVDVYVVFVVVVVICVVGYNPFVMLDGAKQEHGSHVKESGDQRVLLHLRTGTLAQYPCMHCSEHNAPCGISGPSKHPTHVPFV